MNSFDATMLALAAGLLAGQERRSWLAAFAPWAAMACGMLLPEEWAALAPAFGFALVLRGNAAPALLLCLPVYAGVGEAALTTTLWLGGLLLLRPVVERYDAARLPRPLAGAPIRLLVAGGFALALSPLSYL